MLRVAVPNKGSLSEPAIEMLREAGYRQRAARHELVLVDDDNDTEFFFLRPRDIATYVGAGQLDVGITGRDLLLDGHSDAEEVLPLGFARSTFRYAAMPGTAAAAEDLAGKRIATSYVGIVRRDLDQRGIDAEVIHLDGAVETAVRLGVADIVADVVETGATLRQAGLEVFGDPILQSEAVLIRDARRGEASPQVEQLARRLNGVIIARRYVMIDYDVRVEAVDAACELTPGIESPTVSPLHDKGWVAVRAMVVRKDTNTIMDQLWDLGARGILVTDILACRL
ncbi:MAG: ATP phosphoribosyltransferase [Actinobacteria bacterium]|jgi:ATP phosphoribosyltransferase|nr:ATP phosphoribosyltransferase [Actinomycetota bacterium]